MTSPDYDHRRALDDPKWVRLVALAATAGYAVLLLLSTVALSIAGDRIPLYLLMVAVGVLPALSNRRRWAVAAILFVLIAAGLAYIDYERGQAFQRTLRNATLPSPVSTHPA
jgi:glucan phosphoethanolaminetransferase (alkaline phosphatase superfamily)